MENQQKVASAHGWFLAIAGFTFVNFVLYAADAKMCFPVGAMAAALPQIFAPASAKMVTYGVSSALLAVYYFLIARGTKVYWTWVMVIGFLSYAVDAVFVVLTEDWMGAALHAWALFVIGAGIVACHRLKKAGPVIDNLPEDQTPRA
jgi:uncharacterized membrane protein YagU involved in acid resistance